MRSFLYFVLCCSFFSLFGEQNNRDFENRIQVVWPSQLPHVEGSGVFCRYQPAFDDAQKNNKLGILVFFSKESSSKLDFLTQNSFSLPSYLEPLFNVVILMPGIISPADFPLKMDPMILYMAEFSTEFPSILDYDSPCLCCILLDDTGTVKSLDILEM
ncbi:hypothetical protein [Chlamydia sp. 17-3921]|uniref:hypothetical protein n=1 Tax=Chlamydia sp. 17-3921 TaxID=2675798 RepID=UPI00191AD294|nr:hypothetical protein [Chlamydia sp. 17-3921]